MEGIVEQPQDSLLIMARCEPCGETAQHAIAIEENGAAAVLRASCFACGVLTILNIDGEGGDAATTA